MKKLCLLLISVFFFEAAQAQERVLNRGVINHNEESGGGERTNSGFGVKGGVLFSALQGDGKDALDNLKATRNWHAGFYSQFSLGRVFSIQPEALYTRREVNADDSDRRFDYIDVPVLTVANLTDNISIHAGPQVGIMLTAKENDKEIDKEGLNTFDYGAAAGIEAKVSIFRLGGRYYRSFADLGKFDQANANRALNDIKAGNFQVYLGVGF
ncbi:porin family protein [Rufibacter sediminis]|uniref:PorT family protein n=1 Tax=Rufibacter sediminis TaxID=2762756 RepID=A0ABR6VSJ6_9BACT|nr:porin family protein [Rufibacter sediminis]MBC3540154.1 PorT family protein [Rufibacter sediminis]